MLPLLQTSDPPTPGASLGKLPAFQTPACRAGLSPGVDSDSGAGRRGSYQPFPGCGPRSSPLRFFPQAEKLSPSSTELLPILRTHLQPKPIPLSLSLEPSAAIQSPATLCLPITWLGISLLPFHLPWPVAVPQAPEEQGTCGSQRSKPSHVPSTSCFSVIPRAPGSGPS